MNMNIKTLLAAFAAIAFASSANASLVIDQNQPDTVNYITGFFQPNIAQSFQQSADNIAGAGIYLQAGVGNGTSTFTISLWTDLPDEIGASMLASGQTVASGNNIWIDVFWTPVAITPDSTYFLVFEEDRGAYGLAGSTGNPYSRGQAYANGGYVPYPEFDYAFRTYADVSPRDDTPAVPAPGALGILGLGLLGLGLVRRKTA